MWWSVTIGERWKWQALTQVAFLSEAFIDALDGEVAEALCTRGRDGFTASNLCKVLLIIRGRLPTVFLNVRDTAKRIKHSKEYGTYTLSEEH